jgi:peptide deformylase
MAEPSVAPPSAPHGPLPEGGTVRPMTRWGTPVMHRPQQRVTTYDDDLRALAADMVATMYAADGVGLAACQIGVDLAIFVFDCPDESGAHTVGVVCNPELTLPEGKDRHLDESDEGCLSFPGAFIECARPDFATVRGTGLDGEPVEFSGDGLLARCLQHETDHTLGTVFGDRLATKLRKKLQKAHDKAAPEFPDGWPA